MVNKYLTSLTYLVMLGAICLLGVCLIFFARNYVQDKNTDNYKCYISSLILIICMALINLILLN